MIALTSNEQPTNKTNLKKRKKNIMYYYVLFSSSFKKYFIYNHHHHSHNVINFHYKLNIYMCAFHKKKIEFQYRTKKEMTKRRHFV
jgi:hypothetical protein